MKIVVAGGYAVGFSAEIAALLGRVDEVKQRFDGTRASGKADV